MTTGLFFVLNASELIADNWPQWRGPHQNGIVESDVEFSEKTEFKEEWRANVGTGFSSMVVSDGLLYTMGNRDDHDIVWCLNAVTGEVVWQHAYECPLDPNLFEGGPTSTPTVANQKLYTLSRRGDLFCFEAKSGDVLWNINLKESWDLNVPTWGFAGSPLVVGEKLILNAGSAGICLNVHSGDVLWKSDNEEDAGYSTPLLLDIDQRKLAVMLSAKALNAVDLEAGDVVWSIRWITRYGINAADPVIVDDQHLLVSSGYSKGTALIQFDSDSAKQLLRSRDLNNQMSPGILLDGYLYAVSGDAGDDPTLVCLEANTGEQQWSESGFGSGSLLAIGNQILILSGDGMLSLLEVSKEGLNSLTSQQVITGKCWTPKCYANSRLYFRNADGVLVCTKVSH